MSARGKFGGDLAGNGDGVFVEHEVSGVEPDQPGRGQVLQIGLRTRLDEKRVVLAPKYQRPRLVLAECRVPAVIGDNIGLVVFQQIQLA